MKFSEKEMVFFNSISSGPAPFGLDLHIPEEVNRKQYVADAIQSLQEKNIIGPDGKLSKLGIIPIRIFELYKNAKSYVLLNNLLFCETEDRRKICITSDQDGYELFCMDAAAMLALLLKASPYMRRAEPQNMPISHPRKVQEGELEQVLQKYSKQSILAARFEERRPVESKIYCWDDENGYEYNLSAGECTALSPREMRLRFMKLLGISEGISNGGNQDG
jgi:hypothetical protein